MNILASIKAEKKMSFRHWRYRLLHWTFGEDATTPEESDLPRFLYTHYCPLFHLTNLIAVLFPLIFFVKLVVGFFRGIAKCCVLIGDAVGALPWDKLAAVKARLFPKRAPAPPRQPTDEERRAAGIKRDKKNLLEALLRTSFGETEFEAFWDRNRYEYSFLTKEEAEHFYVTRMAKIIAARKRVEERKEKMKQRLIFWTNFSHIFLKWFFNICYIVLAVVVAWVLWKIVPPCISAIFAFIAFLATFEVLPFLIWLGTWLVRVGAVGGALAIVVYCFWRFSLIRKCGYALGSSLSAVSPPFVLLGTWFCLPFKWTVAACVNTVEFIKMFYEENCPPITIVSGEDETIAEELGE